MFQISITNGSVEYDGIPVLSAINFIVRNNEKIALVGRNGCGKTTLLKVLTGEIELVKGTGDENLGFYTTGKPTIGYLEQVAFSDPNVCLLDEVMKAYAPLLELEQRITLALETMQNVGSEESVKTYDNLMSQYEYNGGYTYKKEVLTAIKKFGFTEEDKKKPLSQFSGGQRTKIALLKLLLSKPDLLLLDEPTNHLDVEAIEWLENYLKDYKNAFVVVSHDRMFLDRSINIVYEIEYGETKRYKGNYSQFVEQKQLEYEKAVKDASLKQREVERLSRIVEKFRYKVNKAATAQAKLTQIERIGNVSMPLRADTRTFHANFSPDYESVENTIVMEELVFGYKEPLGEINTIVKKGQKFGIIGANGCGKSTLLKTIMKMIQPLSGICYFGLNTKVGYFDQTATQSNSTETVLDEFSAEFPLLNHTEARTALGSFMFVGDDVFKRVCDLSGGEKVRLALCKIMKHRPNVLILDEPTNHMDIVGKETFEDFLKNYSGTVVVVSHDRYLINRVCTRLGVFNNGNLTLFDGTYSDYEEMMKEQEIQESEEEVKEVKNKKGKKVSDSTLEARRQHRIMVLEEKIQKIEGEIQKLKDKLNSSEVFSDYKKIEEIQKQIDELNKQLEPLVAEWESLNL